jgi:hypothetical protein
MTLLLHSATCATFIIVAALGWNRVPYSAHDAVTLAGDSDVAASLEMVASKCAPRGDDSARHGP